MAVSYPDIIGEYVDSPDRFNTKGLQYAGYFEPEQIAPGETTTLYLFLQSVVDSPLEVTFQIQAPQTGGLFRGNNPVLEVTQPIIELELAEAEAGMLSLPITATEYAEAGEYELVLIPKVEPQSPGQRIRPAQAQSTLYNSPFDSLTGLNVVGTLGATFKEKSVKKAPFSLVILDEEPFEEENGDLKHDYQKIWSKKDVAPFHKAIQELNTRQVKLKNELEIPALYATMYGVSVQKFDTAGLTLRVGEAITLAKILTYTCQYFLGDPNRRSGLLVPVWERAIITGTDTTEAIRVIRSVGYQHILRLAVAMSFSLVAKAVGEYPWSLVERQGVREYIVESVEYGQTMELDFLYLPLLMGGTLISKNITLEDENVRKSLALLKAAHKERIELFADKEMAKAKKIYHLILKKALK